MKKSDAVDMSKDFLAMAKPLKEVTDSKDRQLKKFLAPKFFKEEEDGRLNIYSKRSKRSNIAPKMVIQVIEKFMTMVKPVGFTLQAAGQDGQQERIVTAAVRQVFNRTGTEAIMGKGGAFRNLFGYGRAFTLVSYNEKDGEFPIEFTPLRNDQVFVDPNAVTFEKGGKGRDVQELAIVFTYPKSLFESMHPRVNIDDVRGQINDGSSRFNNLEKSNQQNGQNTDEEEIQVMYYYNLKEKLFLKVAGAKMKVLEKLEGDNYPLIIEGKAVLPVIYWRFRPGVEGFDDYGITELIFDLAEKDNELLNAEITSGMYNSDPYTLVNVPEDKAGYLFKAMKHADAAKAKGGRGFIPMPYNTASGQTSFQSLLYQTGGTQAARMAITQQLARLGIILDEADRGQVTATQILSERDVQASVVLQTLQENAWAFEKMVRLIIHFIKEYVDVKDETPLEINEKIKVERPVEPTPEVAQMMQATGQTKPPTESVEIDTSTITLGLVAGTLKEHNYYPIMNTRTGRIPSGVEKQINLTRGMNITTPGTKLNDEVRRDYLNEIGIEASLEDLKASPQQAPATPPVPDNEMKNMQPMRSETDRASINPREGNDNTPIF